MRMGLEYPKVSRRPSLPPARPFRVAPPRSNRGGPVQLSVARITGQEDLVHSREDQRLERNASSVEYFDEEHVNPSVSLRSSGNHGTSPAESYIPCRIRRRTSW